MIQYSTIIIILLLFYQVIGFNIKNIIEQISRPNNNNNILIRPVEKVEKAPLLSVIDPDTQTKVHLVGVSHGSATSAELVQKTISKVRPASVVLELCDERYLSICLDAKIRPNCNNQFINNAYEKKMATLQENQELANSMKGMSIVAAISAYFKFMRTQGILVGSFVSMGLFVGSLQRFTRSPTLDDEFTTAMKVSERLNIPLRMGDALQSDTLKSVKKLASFDLIDPEKVIMGAKSLAFSAFGLNIDKFPDNSNQDSEVLRKNLALSKWVNIPQTYAENKAMVKSLLPIFLISMVSTLIGYLPEVGSANDLPSYFLDTIHGVPHIAHTVTDTTISSTDISSTAASTSPIMSALQSIGNWMNQDIPADVQVAINTAADFFSLLLLVRMSKIIGSDRDRIIASKVQAVCREFPGTEVVVVIGMLHCNGVARWLLSGQDPRIETL